MKRFFTFALCTVLIFGALALTACQFNGLGEKNEVKGSEGLTYELNFMRDGYVVTGLGTCTDTKIVIPSTYNGLPVMSIADGAFRAKESPKVEAPDDGKDKEKEKEKEKEKLSLGTTLLSLKNTFSFFGFLADIQQRSDSDSAEAMENAGNITDVVIPDSVMDIGDEAFYGCEKLGSFEISNLINLIGTDAFKDTAYYLDESNWTDDTLYLDEYLVEVRTNVTGRFEVREGTVNIANNAFEGCTGITAVSFPSSLRFVGSRAFCGCTGITEVDLTIPGIQIANYAFMNCTALTTVKIATNDTPNAPPVKSFIGIGLDRVDDVFMPGGSSDIAFDPTADPNLIYSASVGYEAFSGCSSLTTVTFGSNVGYFGGYVFRDCTSLESIDLSMIKVYTPDTVIVTPGYNHRWHMSLQGLFSGCTSLKNVKLPIGIQWLDSTFEGCTSLTSFTVPNTVKGLNRTFVGCTSLTNVTIPSSVNAIAGTFYGCSSLSDIELPDTLQKIGGKTFVHCTSLKSVYVPDSVTTLGESAFVGGEEESINISIGKGISTFERDSINYVYTITFRGTMDEWNRIPRNDRWGGQSPMGEYADIICTDGTLVDGKTASKTMEGILLSDGTVYASFLGVTLKAYPDSRDERVEMSLDEVEAELKAKGETGWRRVNAAEIIQMNGVKGEALYYHIKMVALHYSQGGDKPQLGGNSSENENFMKGLLLPDGTLYVRIDGVTVAVKDGKVEKIEIDIDKLEAELVKSGSKDWSTFNNQQIKKRVGDVIYDQILSISPKKN